MGLAGDHRPVTTRNRPSHPIGSTEPALDFGHTRWQVNQEKVHEATGRA